MHFMYLLLVAATVLLSSLVISAKQSTVAEADTQPNSIDVGDAKRFLRSNKWIDDDSTDYAEKEERGTTANMKDAIEKLNRWLDRAKSPGQVRIIKLPKAGYSGEKLDDLAKQYGDAYRARYGTFKGQ
ncbi:hypothetical protein PC129_g18997 [Phytophthora cactorum]|uniref:RxLR effector protein n=1 Tax=Phytophthora cactorum TaxID=29920 RepID=A0A329RS30_9STRA|nr:hypothetical protein GQ600_18913 [Phytophthora cactorum]KAG2776205.1 hypothetical protein Pcac1_g13292 [Phytophthora cactorum]KAG2802803.1 hypothetical protein PC111_g18945 [Phytophthora cactorum]KAG2822186.1 hypothetical protein PC112_g11054 [Phytophthora cactorum]KAG2838928.1 hypothetical protein PC113_g19569 [Phytophthora cactorum]